MRNKILSVIPNTLTSINLFCGCIAILAFLNGFGSLGVILILIAAFVDFFDGFAARLLKVQSDLGKELDSLADMVSFGVVPGVILYMALLKTTNFRSFAELMDAGIYYPLIGFVITVFSGLRLAKFNIDTRQSVSFIGLPTPANTLFFLTIPLIWVNDSQDGFWMELINSKTLLIALTFVFSYLLVAELPLIALKFKGFGFKANWYKYVLILSTVIASILFTYLAIPVVIGLYLLLSAFVYFTAKK